MAFPWVAGIANGAEKVTSSGSNLDNKLGHAAQTEDGRVFRFMKNGSAALVAGVVVQGPAANSSDDAALPVASASSGGFTVTPTVQAATTKDQYASGFLVIDTAPGEGMYKIKANTAAASGAEVTVTLDDNDPLRVALTSATRVGLRPNPYKDVIVAPTTITGPIVGVAPVAVNSGAYFWGQVSGFGGLNTDVAPAVNTDLIFSGTSAGHANARSSALNDVPEPSIAVGVDAGAGADKVNFVRINIE